MKHKLTDRRCAECHGSFRGAGRKLTCSPECSRSRLNRQLGNLATRRREESKSRLRLNCEICNNVFDARHSLHKYCSDPCRAQGLLRAIQRQTARRQAAVKGV